MKKRIAAFAAICLLAAACCACGGTAATAAYQVETGDKIQVRLDTSSGFSLTQTSPFVVTKGEATVGTGVFLTLENYQQYLTQLRKGSDRVELLAEGEKDKNSYVFYRCEGDYGIEYDFLILISDSSTGVLLGCETTQEAALECFNALTFSKISG